MDTSTSTAKTAAAEGCATAQLAYLLTKEALAEQTAIVVLPLLILESAAIIEGLTAYAATEPNWTQACFAAGRAQARAQSYWD